MREKKTFTVDVIKCDFCGNDTYTNKENIFYTCEICGKDFCDDCGNVFKNQNIRADKLVLRICNDCIKKMKYKDIDNADYDEEDEEE